MNTVFFMYHRITLLDVLYGQSWGYALSDTLICSRILKIIFYSLAIRSLHLLEQGELAHMNCKLDVLTDFCKKSEKKKIIHNSFKKYSEINLTKEVRNFYYANYRTLKKEIEETL